LKESLAYLVTFKVSVSGIRKGIERHISRATYNTSSKKLESGKELKGFYSNFAVYFPIDQLESGKELKVS